MDVDRPLPTPITPEAKPFWDGCRAEKLMLPRCEECGHVFFYPRILCPRCHSRRIGWMQASGRGTLHSFEIAYQDVDGPNSDIGLWGRKIPCELLQLGTEAVEIDSRIAPAEGELVLVKKCASGFHGTNLASYLNAHGVDTVIVTGVTMAGCVRHTTEDAIAHGFRPIVVREAVGDRVPGVVEWNLFDIDAKFGDVEALEDVLAYLDGIEPFASRAGVIGRQTA